ncbi:MAG: helix-turn-helix domain-containing protein [Ignavibacteriales bacterium]|nr:MAG: helix-turn-helix domain-containing protein [Ignavibacteriales bacterium]
MATEALKKFADELKTAREVKEISLSQVSAKTKIDLKFLQAIEDANFDVLPEIYIRAFIREFAQTIDLNSKEVLQKFDIARLGKPEEKPQPQLETASKEDSVNLQGIPEAKEFDSTEVLQPSILEAGKAAKSLRLNYIIGGSILFVALIVVYFAFIRNSSPEIIQEKLDQETSTENTQRFEIDKSSQSQTSGLVDQSALVPDSLHLSVFAVARVWIKVTTDGKTVHQNIVQANTRLNYAATKNFSVSVGNAGLVQIFFNNKQIENVGKLGEIRNLFITHDNIRYFTIAPQSKNEKKSSTKN